MGRRMTIKAAAVEVGLTEWNLREGIRTRRYPAMRAGIGSGKYIVDVDLLEQRITELMLQNIAPEPQPEAIGGIRRICA